MSLARTFFLSLALVGCESRRAAAPDWVTSAPPATVMAISCRAGWALDQSNLQTVLRHYPPAGRALESFLRRLGINPRQETGRISVYLFNAVPAAGGLPGPAAEFVIRLEGFRSPGALQVAIADAFPSEGTLALDHRDLPLFGVLDLNPYHIRAVADGDGHVWLGDQAALRRLDSGHRRGRGALAAAAAWIGGTAAIQGFLRPSAMLGDSSGQVPGDLARDLPRGVEALAWGVTPGAGPASANSFDLAITGSREAVAQVEPWIQRFVAAAAAMPGPALAPEILQESTRIGLRSPLSPEQVDMALARLGQPGLPRH